MSRVLSAIRRLADIELVADMLGFVSMVLFLAVAFGFLAEASDLVTSWRLDR